MNETELRDLVASELDVASEDVHDSTELNTDSLTLTEIIVRLEARLGCTVTDSEQESVKTYADLKKLVELKEKA